MSISAETARSQYTLTSLGQTLAISWFFLSAADLKVVKTVSGVDTVLELTTHYSVTGAGNEAGGSITLESAAAAIGNVITIYRNGSQVQPLDMAYNSQFPAESVEQAYDRLTMLVQQLWLYVQRSLRIPVSNAAVSEMTKADRANSIVGFDSNGDLEFTDQDEFTAPAQAAQAAAEVAQAAAEASETAAAASASAASGSASAASASATAAASSALAAAQAVGSVEIINDYTIGDFRQLDPVMSVVKLMNAGSTVEIAEYGDSTTVGYINGSTVGSTPAPSILQSVLRLFFNNTSITVYNRGVSATSTSDVTGDWPATMAAEDATVIFLNYGMNDNTGLTHIQFADNLRYLIKEARAAAKFVILKTPNPARAQGSLGSQTKAELVKEYAEVVRQVGRETGTPVIDVYKAVTDRWSVGTNIVTDITDGIHPSDTVYQAIGRECAWFFIGHPGAVLRDKEINPVSTPNWRYVTLSSTGAVYSLVGIYLKANKIICAIRVDKPGLDVYVGGALTSSTTTDLTVKVDDATVGNISQYASTHVNAWPCDMDLMVIENATPGVHVIELNATGAEYAIANYVRAWPTRVPGKALLSKAAGNALTVGYRRAELPKVTVTSDSTDIKHFITDIPMSCFNRTLDIQFTATMPKLTGVVLMANRRSSTADTRGGVVVFANAITGYLAVGEGGEAAYGTPVVIGSSDLSGGSHVYRITVDSAGEMTFYVDGSSVGTHTLTKALFGGKLGFFMAESATLEVSDIEIY